MPSLFASQVHDQYLAQQIDIARAVLDRGWIRTGLNSIYAIARMRPRSLKRLIKPAMRSVLKRIRR